MKIGITDDCVYPERGDLIFRDQNLHAARHANEKWRSRSTRTNKSPGSSAGSPGSASSPPQTVSSSGLEDQVMARFFFDWTLKPDAVKKTGISFLEYLPEFYANCDPESILSKTVKAVAYANYAQRFRVAEARAHAIENCTAALQKMQAEMKNPDLTKVDETLISMVLLGMYEVRTVQTYR